MMPPEPSRRLEWIIIASQFAPPYMFSGVAVALPHMGRELSAGAVSLALVETLFLAGSLAFLLPLGRLADLSDKRTLYKAGLISFSATSLLIAALHSMPVILFIRLLQGIASAAFAVTGPAILAEIVPPHRRGRAFGASLGAIYAGLTLGPISAGLLIDLWSWRLVFLAGALLLMLASLLMSSQLKSKWRSPESFSRHLPSVALVVGAVLSFVASSSIVARPAVAVPLALLGVVLAGVFLRLQTRLDDPLIDIRAIFANVPLRSALLVQLLLYMNAYSAIFMLSLYLQTALGASAKSAGQVLALGSVLMALTAPVAGAFADRCAPTLLTRLGVLAVAASGAAGALLTEHSSVSAVLTLLILHGIGFGLFASPNMTVIMASVSAKEHSLASALSAKARGLGMTGGMLLCGLLISLRVGNEPVAKHVPEFVGAMQCAFLILTLFCTLSLLLSLLLPRSTALRP